MSAQSHPAYSTSSASRAGCKNGCSRSIWLLLQECAATPEPGRDPPGEPHVFNVSLFFDLTPMVFSLRIRAFR